MRVFKDVKRAMKKREVLLLKIFSAVLVLFIGGISLSTSFRGNVVESLSSIYGSVLVSLTNRDRTLLNISELKVSPILEKAAQMKADDMAKNGYFSHNTPDGKTPWYWIDLVDYKYVVAGENLAVNFNESENVQNAWMNSPTHRANIVNSKFTEIGIASSTGIYKGREAVFVVQLFATPAK